MSDLVDEVLGEVPTPPRIDLVDVGPAVRTVARPRLVVDCRSEVVCGGEGARVGRTAGAGGC